MHLFLLKNDNLKLNLMSFVARTLFSDLSSVSWPGLLTQACTLVDIALFDYHNHADKYMSYMYIYLSNLPQEVPARGLDPVGRALDRPVIAPGDRFNKMKKQFHMSRRGYMNILTKSMRTCRCCSCRRRCSRRGWRGPRSRNGGRCQGGNDPFAASPPLPKWRSSSSTCGTNGRRWSDLASCLLADNDNN